jgi:HK97 family phage portal protein
MKPWNFVRKMFGLSISNPGTMSSVDSRGGWMSLVRESFGGAFQGNVVVDAPREVLAFSAVYSCVTIIASDIAKMEIDLVQEEASGICTEVENSPAFLPVLRKPNRFQTRIKLIEQWVVSKLLFGNAYILKSRDGRGVVTGLFVLDPQRVVPLVAQSGDIYYQLSADYLSGLQEAIVVPASEIIHDRMVCLWHPLVGVSPIYACGYSATMGTRIQRNSTTFFANQSRPSGILTAPSSITDETAIRLKRDWDENFTGVNSGKVAVLGDGLKYEAMAVPAVDAQLIDQLRWTVEDVARCFHVPIYKIGGPIPPQTTIDGLNQAYYSDCLQALIESMEASLDEGLSLPSGYYTEFDLDGLMRMDTAARYEALNKAVAGGWMSPDEARISENLPPVPGGASPMMQQQNYSLAALAKRDARADPFGTAAPPAPAATQPDPAAAASGAAAAAKAEAEFAEFFELVTKGFKCQT